MCDPADPIKITSRVKARVVFFNNLTVPITKGFPVNEKPIVALPVLLLLSDGWGFGM